MSTTEQRSPAGAPASDYSERMSARQSDAKRWKRWEKWLSNLRLVIFLAALLVGWFVFGSRQISVPWIIPPVVAFVALLIGHDRIIQRRSRADRAVAHYAAGINRIEDRWAGSGVGGDRHREESHPYAEDLDIFGSGSLFELLCTARTAAGEETLARWLQRPASAADARARQIAVEELRPRVDLREELSLLGEDVRSHLAPESLVSWGATTARRAAPGLRAAATALSGVTLLSLAGWLATGMGPLPFIAAASAQSVFALALRARVRPTIRSVSGPTRDLALLAGLLERLEREPFAAPLLVSLRAALDTDGVSPSRRIAELQRLTDLLDARSNQFFAPIGALLLWGTQLGLAIENWHRSCGPALGPWIESAGEIEALCALAGYAYEHPDDPYPEIVDEGPVFEARALGHPLISDEICVRNDLDLDARRQALIVSGSNMSGKSTLLRTVGTNTVLASAGAPVRAESLRLSPLAVAASIHVLDSLQSGTSHFYAEIKRLRQVVDLTDGEIPVLFLLDEILHGTNSHDRRIGANAIVRGLLQRGAVGLVTTHDLALAKIADELAPTAENVHFEDHLEDGKMCFDYRLHSGVVTRSNALELMRSIGLEV